MLELRAGEKRAAEQVTRHLALTSAGADDYESQSTHTMVEHKSDRIAR